MRIFSGKRATGAAAAKRLVALALAAALPHMAAAAPAPAATSDAAQAAYDHQTGQASGKRQHETVRIIREVDKASPAVAARPTPSPTASGAVDATVKSHSNTNNN